MDKVITMRTKPDKIIQMFNKAREKGDTLNLKLNDGFIYLAGDILSKLQNNKHFIALNNKWVEIE